VFLVRALQEIRDLFADDLFWRVMMFMTGVFFLAIPTLAIIFNVLSRDTDMALGILLAIFAIFGSFLFYAAVWGSARILEKAVNWGNSGEIAFFLGLVTFAIPITMIIRYVRRREQRRNT